MTSSNRWIRRTFLAGMVAVVFSCGLAPAVEVTIDSAALSNAYMNVFELPSNGGGYVFGSGWGIADLNAVFPTASTVTFTPNTIGDPNPFWYTPSGGPGATGNKIMEANLYAQPADGTYSGQTVTFKGNVTAFTLQTGTNPNTDYTFKAFVRDFAPDYSSVIEQAFPITSTGEFSISLATINDPTRHIQWGLQMRGANVWITDVDSKGSVTLAAVAPVPEPSSLAVVAAAGLTLAPIARRRLIRNRVRTSAA